MKMIILFTVLLFAFAPALSAEESDSENFYQLGILMQDLDLENQAQFMQINELASSLSSMQRMVLLESNKKSSGLPFVLNLILGLGIGSYVQGDSKGGTTALVGELSSLALLLAGAGQATVNPYTGDIEGGEMMYPGYIGMVGFRLYELIRPFSFAKEYNSKLSNALMNVSLSPVLDEQQEMKMELLVNNRC